MWKKAAQRAWQNSWGIAVVVFMVSYVVFSSNMASFCMGFDGFHPNSVSPMPILGLLPRTLLCAYRLSPETATFQTQISDTSLLLAGPLSNHITFTWIRGLLAKHKASIPTLMVLVAGSPRLPWLISRLLGCPLVTAKSNGFEIFFAFADV